MQAQGSTLRGWTALGRDPENDIRRRGAIRDSAFITAIEPTIDRSRYELRADSTPLIIAGHSLGAEIATWTAAHTCQPRVADAIGEVPGDEHIALIRGTKDKLTSADAALMAAGGDRIERFSVILAGHSLQGLSMAGFETHHAVVWLLASDKAAR